MTRPAKKTADQGPLIIVKPERETITLRVIGCQVSHFD